MNDKKVFATLRPRDVAKVKVKGEVLGAIGLSRPYIWLLKAKMVWAIIRAEIGDSTND